LHDALIDVILCLRVFIKYKYNEDICGKNEIITEYIKRISPEGYVCNLEKAKMDTDVDIENIKLEIIDPFDESDNLSTTTSSTTKSKSKSKKGGKKNKKQKAKTKRRRSKRLLAAAAVKKGAKFTF
jgi:hypothetical protein